MFSKVFQLESFMTLKLCCKELTLYQTTNLEWSKLKEFADDNFKFDENGRNLYEWVGNTVGKEEIARCEQFLHFLQRFQKTCTTDT